MDSSSAFSLRKRTILSALGAPEEQYRDRSPKGSVDVGIRDLIDLLNGLDGLVTTSSCAGRVSLFVEGSKAESAARARDLDVTQPAVDVPPPRPPKGMGGHWLFVTHEPTGLVQLDACIASLDQVDRPANAAAATAASQDALTSEARSEPPTMPSQYEPGKYSTLPLIRLQFEPMV
jgi:tRNA wybutosine-synthesizing protein 3